MPPRVSSDRHSAEKNNAKFKVQNRKGTVFKPGTDSDYILDLTGSKDPVGTVKKIQAEYNRRLEALRAKYASSLKKAGLPAKPRTDWHKKLDVDFMADPGSVSQKQFGAIAKENNDAYRFKESAEVEAAMRAPDGGKVLKPKHYVSYFKEMGEFAQKKNKLHQKLAKNPALLNDPMYQAELTKVRALEQKYLVRQQALINKINTDYKLGQTPYNGSPKNPFWQFGVTSDGKAKVFKTHYTAEAADRGPGKDRLVAKASALSGHSMYKNQMKFIQMIGLASKSNTKAWPAPEKDLAAIMKNMPPAQKAQAREIIEATGGNELATKTTRQLRAITPNTKPGIKANLEQKAAKVDNLVNLLLSENSGKSPRLRQQFSNSYNSVLKVHGQIQTLKQAYHTSAQVKEYFDLLNKAMDPNTSEREAEALFEKAQAVSLQMAQSNVEGASMAYIMSKFPKLAACYAAWSLGYDGTSFIINNTETGKAFLAESVKATVSLEDMLGDLRSLVTTGETLSERSRKQNQLVADKFEAALARGTVVMIPGHTKEEALAYIRAGDFKRLHYCRLKSSVERKRLEKLVSPDEVAKEKGKEDLTEIDKLKELAQKGDAEAQYKLGLYYKDKKADYKMAAYWFELSARHKYAPAQYELGLSYFLNQGVERNKKLAYKLFAAARKQGHQKSKEAIDKFFLANLKVLSAEVTPKQGGLDTKFTITVEYKTQSVDPHENLIVAESGNLVGPVTMEFPASQKRQLEPRMGENETVTKTWIVKPAVFGDYQFNYKINEGYANYKGKVNFKVAEAQPLHMISALAYPERSKPGRDITLLMEFKAPIDQEVKEHVEIINPAGAVTIQTDKKYIPKIDTLLQLKAFKVHELGRNQFRYRISSGAKSITGTVPFYIEHKRPTRTVKDTKLVSRLVPVAGSGGLQGSSWKVTGSGYKNGPRTYSVTCLSANPGSFKVRVTGHRSGDRPAIFTGTKSGSRIRLTGYRIDHSRAVNQSFTRKIWVNAFLQSQSSVSGSFGSAKNSKYTYSMKGYRTSAARPEYVSKQFREAVTRQEPIPPSAAELARKRKAEEFLRKYEKRGLESLSSLQNLEKVYRNSGKSKKAFEMYRDLATSKSSHATYGLLKQGYFLMHGIGVPKAPDMAFHYYKLAADKNDKGGLFKVGECYEKGTGVTKDLKQARKFYEKARDKGHINAQRKLDALDKARGIDPF